VNSSWFPFSHRGKREKSLVIGIVYKYGTAVGLEEFLKGVIRHE
jgi:hypothetical protein